MSERTAYFEVADQDGYIFSNCKYEDLIVYTDTSNQAIHFGNTMSNNSAFMIRNNDVNILRNMSIGKSNPFYPLDVLGNAAIDGSLTSTKHVVSRGLQVKKRSTPYFADTTLPSGIVAGFSNDTFGLNLSISSNNTDNYIRFITVSNENITELARITGKGNFGIGTSNPTSKLHIIGNSYIQGSISTGHVIPLSNELYDLGASNMRFRDLYLSSNTIFLGDGKIKKTSQGIAIMDSNDKMTASMASMMMLSNNGGYVLLHTSNHYLGIGLSNPEYTLDINGSSRIGCNLEVKGNLTIRGVTTTVESQTVNVTDNVIRINNGAAYTSGLQAGIEVNRGTGYSNYYFVFDEASQYFKIGQTEQLQTVATREDAPMPFSIPYYTSSSNIYSSCNLFVYSNNNFGIRTTSPVYPLDLPASGRVATTFFEYNDSNLRIGNKALETSGTLNTNFAIFQGTSGDTVINSASGQPLGLKIGNVEYLRITSNGNIGINTTSPTFGLDVNGTGRFSGNSFQLSDGGSNTMFTVDRSFGLNGAVLSANAFMNSQGQYVRQKASAGIVQIDFHTGMNSNTDPPFIKFSGADIGGTDGQAATLNAWMTIINRNVGIGTITPNARLHIIGNTTGGTVAQGFMDSSNAPIYISDATTYPRVLHKSVDATVSTVYNYEPTKTVYWGETTDTGAYYFRGRHMIIQNGKVGIRNTNPDAYLDVVGSGSFNVTNYVNYFNSGSSQSTLSFGGSGTTNNATIKASDHVWASGFATYSDKRIKKNIEKLSLDWDKFSKIEIVKFDYIDQVQYPHKSVGVIAQDVKAYNPEYISTSKSIIPNIFKTLPINKDKISIKYLDESVKRDIKAGAKLKILKDSNSEFEEVNILEKGKTWVRIDKLFSQVSEVFVYGTSVDDFMTVNYETLAITSIEYIKDLKKENDALKVRIKRIEDFLKTKFQDFYSI